jgi:hypothetical protein
MANVLQSLVSKPWRVALTTILIASPGGSQECLAVSGPSMYDHISEERRVVGLMMFREPAPERALAPQDDTHANPSARVDR